MSARMLLTTVVAMLCLTGCGSPSGESGDHPSEPTESTESAMNIDEGQRHYREVIEEIKASTHCQGAPLDWQQVKPESVEGAESDDAGNYTAYVYRGPFLGSDVPCHGEDFTTTVDRITAVLEDNGGIADDVVLDDANDYAQGGEVKWLDNHGATFTFSSGAKTSFSMVSGELPPS